MPIFSVLTLPRVQFLDWIPLFRAFPFGHSSAPQAFTLVFQEVRIILSPRGLFLSLKLPG